MIHGLNVLFQLNERRIKTPYDITQAKARVFTSGVNIVLDTDFGLVVKFDGVHHIEITVPGDYFNKVLNWTRICSSSLIVVLYTESDISRLLPFVSVARKH